ncbi:MAG: FAD-dependent oxidoreductase [Tenericutes bacterium]|nr:FAD-dependent oxidoreductase [Mycoplasmatota bacterium]
MEKEKLEVEIAARKCMNCVTKPCQIGCPLNIDIPEFIKNFRNGNYEEAFKVLCKSTVLPSVCGRICPVDKQCQGSCAKKVSYDPVEIGKIESYIGDLALKNEWSLPKKTKKNGKVAVIGSGPSGLTCAAFLAENGYQVTIYEKHDYLGGLLYHGIPKFRLDRELVQKMIKQILDLGINVKTNVSLGKDISLEELEKEYDAVFLGLGANLSKMMGLKGETLRGVYGANELLENLVHPDYSDKSVVVIGGGGVSIDMARTAIRMGAKEVGVIYRRSRNEMSAEMDDIKQAKKEKIKFLFQTNVIGINGEEEVKSIECVKTSLDKDKKAINVEGSNFTIDTDYVIMAVGSRADSNLLEKLKLDVKENGYLMVNTNNQTSNPKIFAAGDLTGAKSTVAWACRNGRDTAYSIMNFIKEGE